MFFYGAPDIGGKAGKAGMEVLPSGRISGQKAQKGPEKNGWPEKFYCRRGLKFIFVNV